jgi:predicted N-acetyltransferase YhbS
VSAEVFGPEPLGPDHNVQEFDCGVESLNEYLTRRALPDQRADKSQTLVVVRDERVCGYFSLAAASVDPEDATDRAARGQGAQAIPAVLLARLAVDIRCKGQGIGGALLVEALARSAAAADLIGARVVLVNAVSDEAKGFYLHYGFEPSPTNPLHLVMLMKDIRKTLRVG